MTSTDLTQHRPGVELPARYGFGPEQTAAIKATVGKDLNDSEFVLLLELAARYQLDPFARQVWGVKLGGESKPASIIVGRDGYLAIAERHAAYDGMDADVVRQNDRFQIERTAHGPVVHHEYGTGDRGPIKGAWACVYRKDRRVPTYFYAPIEDYKPTGNRLTYSPWNKQESVMMLKCAQSTALRLAFNISGFVPAEEAGVLEDGTRLNGAQEQPVVSDDPETFDWPEDPDMRGRLAEAFKRGNEIRPLAFPPAKVRMLLRGRDATGYEMLAREIEEWIARREQPVEAVQGEIVEES